MGESHVRKCFQVKSKLKLDPKGEFSGANSVKICLTLMQGRGLLSVFGSRLLWECGEGT